MVGGARSSPAGAALALLSPHHSKRRSPTGSFPTHAAQQQSSLISCQSQHVVWAMATVWTIWLLCMLLMAARPSLLDPLVRRHEHAAAAAALAREHDGPNHHHGLPGMVERPHGAHHHQPATTLTQAQTASLQLQREAQQKAAAAAAAATQGKQRAAIVIPGINGDVDQIVAAAPQPGPAAAATTPPSQQQQQQQQAPSATPIELRSSPTPPRASSGVQGATRNPPGWRTTPPGKAQCDHSGADAHPSFPQYVLGSMGPGLSADDYESDEAPLRQLEVASVHPTRATYEWGPTTAQRGVLTYMCTSDPEDVRELMQSLAAIQASFVQHYDYPVAIFHEDYDRELMARVQAAAPLVFIYFVKIRFQLPAHLRPLEAEGVRDVRHVIPNPEHATGFHEHQHGLRPYVKRAAKYPYGYQHMCRFFSGAGFMLPFFDSFDWYWRLDSDTICHGRAVHDVFDHLASCGMEYSHLAPMFGDGGDVVEGLWHAAINFTVEHSVKPRWLHGHPSYKNWGLDGLFSQVPAFNTNCEVASLAMLRSENVQKLHRFLDQKGGYFLHRWGDAPVRFLGVAMNVDERKTEALHGIQCAHN